MRNSRDTGIWNKGQNNENKNQYKNIFHLWKMQRFDPALSTGLKEISTTAVTGGGYEPTTVPI
jgi:hypothetical protein